MIQNMSVLSAVYKFVSIIFLSRLTPYADEITGDHHFDIAGQLLVIYSAFVNTWFTNVNTLMQCVSYL